MNLNQQVWSPRRVSVLGMVIIAVIAAAVAVTIGLYQQAIGQAGQARVAASDSQDAQQLVSIFAQQQLAMFGYLASGTPAYLTAAEALNTQFDQIAGSLSHKTPALATADRRPGKLLLRLSGRSPAGDRRPGTQFRGDRKARPERERCHSATEHPER